MAESSATTPDAADKPSPPREADPSATTPKAADEALAEQPAAPSDQPTVAPPAKSEEPSPTQPDEQSPAGELEPSPAATSDEPTTDRPDQKPPWSRLWTATRRRLTPTTENADDQPPAALESSDAPSDEADEQPAPKSTWSRPWAIARRRLTPDAKTAEQPTVGDESTETTPDTADEPPTAQPDQKPAWSRLWAATRRRLTPTTETVADQPMAGQPDQKPLRAATRRRLTPTTGVVDDQPAVAPEAPEAPSPDNADELATDQPDQKPAWSPLSAADVRPTAETAAEPSSVASDSSEPPAPEVAGPQESVEAAPDTADEPPTEHPDQKPAWSRLWAAALRRPTPDAETAEPQPPLTSDSAEVVPDEPPATQPNQKPAWSRLWAAALRRPTPDADGQPPEESDATGPAEQDEPQVPVLEAPPGRRPALRLRPAAPPEDHAEDNAEGESESSEVSGVDAPAAKAPPVPPMAPPRPGPPMGPPLPPLEPRPGGPRPGGPRPGGPGGPGRPGGPGGPGGPPPGGPASRPAAGARPARPRPHPRVIRRQRRRRRMLASLALLVLLGSGGLTATAYYVDSVPTPNELELPESTKIYYADESTPMATLGREDRTLLTYEEMNDAVRQTIVAAEDQSFWTNDGIDLKGVLRAAWNNVTGGDTQGASTITQQYARVAADLKGVTYQRKLREAVIAWKLTQKYSKEKILEFYLNTVPFGRGAYGIEAAAKAYLGKTANRHAPAYLQVTIPEAMVLVSMVKQPEPDLVDFAGQPGYDPTRSEQAQRNSKERWAYVLNGMVRMGYLTEAQAKAMRYPENAVKPFDPASRQSGLDRPTGLVVSHVLSELRQTEPFRGKSADYIDNGGFRIITTIDKAAQDVAEQTADIRRTTAPAIVQGQPANWQAALVAVEPGTGRVLAYYGGKNGTGADYAGWFYDADGDPRGFGSHPPGSSFKVYDLAEALRQGISLDSVWDAPASKEFPNSGRTKNTAAGPVRNASSAPCQPRCTLSDSAVASLNVPFYELTERLGTANVIEMARRAGIDDIWANVAGKPNPVRVDLRGRTGTDVAGEFSPEIGIGQYGITVLDHANGMATMAAGGRRAQAHFVKSVMKGRDQVYAEDLTVTDIGLSAVQVADLSATLTRVAAAKLGNDWDAAGKTGTWQAGASTTRNAHTWMVGYTRALAAAVWLGTSDGKALITKKGATDVFGSNYPGPIWRQFMERATTSMRLDPAWRKFDRPAAQPVDGSRAPTTPPSRQAAATGTPVRAARRRRVEPNKLSRTGARQSRPLDGRRRPQRAEVVEHAVIDGPRGV